MIKKNKKKKKKEEENKIITIMICKSRTQVEHTPARAAQNGPFSKLML